MAHKYGDERIAGFLQQKRECKYPKDVPYHPRSNAHGGAQCQYFVDDLLYESDLLREAAKRGDVVFQEDYEVGEGGLSWNTDLVIGLPEGEVHSPLDSKRCIAQADPDELWLALDAKSIMTEHQKARRNRVRDINSFADIMHHHHERAIAGGVLLINLADRFDSPTRDPDDITDHPNVERIVSEILDMFRAIDRSGGDVSNNLDGAACVVVEHTNLLDDDHQTKLVIDPPAPQQGDEVDYLDEYIPDIASNSLATKVKKADLRDNLDLTRLSELNNQMIDNIRKYHRSLEYLENEEATSQS